MLTTILGIPAHPLIIHAAVVFIPLLIIGAIVLAAWPPLHGRIGWAVLTLAVIAPLSALFAKLSGQNFRNLLIEKKLTSPQLLTKITQHNSYGNHTFWWTLGLGVLTLVLLAVAWRSKEAGRRPAVRIGATAVMVVIGGIVGYYVFKTGDTGAHIVWQGI